MIPNLPSWSDETMNEAMEVVLTFERAGRGELAALVFAPIGRELERRAKSANTGMPVESEPIRIDKPSAPVLRRTLPLMPVAIHYTKHSEPVAAYLAFVATSMMVVAGDYIR